jgi:hypothetical protein
MRIDVMRLGGWRGVILDLARRDLGDHDRGADHVARALLFARA